MAPANYKPLSRMDKKEVGRENPFVGGVDKWDIIYNRGIIFEPLEG